MFYSIGIHKLVLGRMWTLLQLDLNLDLCFCHIILINIAVHLKKSFYSAFLAILVPECVKSIQLSCHLQMIFYEKYRLITNQPNRIRVGDIRDKI